MNDCKKKYLYNKSLIFIECVSNYKLKVSFIESL